MYVFVSNLASFSCTMFIGPTAVAGKVLQNKVCPSFHLPECLLRIGSLFFSKFWHGAGNPYEVARGRARFFFLIKTSFAPNTGSNSKKCPKNSCFFV